MASTPGRPEAPPTTLLTLPEELLEEVLLRLPAAADLARASIAWVSFRRLVTDHRFLRRFRARQPPPLLGIVSHQSHRYLPLLQLAQPPHPSAAAASTFAGSRAADFSCSFLPSAERWHVRDLRDGRVLLSGVPEGSKFCCRDLARDLAVCDPLYRRYTLLPAIPDDLAALAQQSDMGHFEPFLAPPAAEDEEGISFRVICLARCTARLVLLIFSSGSGDGQWRAVTLDNWVSLLAGLDNPAPVIKPESSLWPRMRHYAHGYFCWAFYPANKNKLIMLDTRSMDFSAVNLPPRTRNTQVAILEAGEGRLGMFIMSI
ncbi:unnamed protein product [Triticum aestivum]|uniref:F-box domain-containing protein n=2 Tax=Triticum aestivum TaxID=4565 RepID=A0A9R1EP80_WHEAT|nr:uncharacterized protein LOC123051693 [Triticum aestivum]KAF7014277.1 hypothetical protein CFC21_028294 [Triticum aestivum]SPT16515.1 unnamed protein product [Triticum aestivum]